MSLLGNDTLKALFCRAFKAIYDDGLFLRCTLYEHDEDKPEIEESTPQPIKLQIDQCSETMRMEQGYSDDDVRILILQQGFEGKKPSSDDVIIAQGQRYQIASVIEDPAQCYFDIRAVRQASE